MALGTVTLVEHLETLGDRKAALVNIQCSSGANYTSPGGEPIAAGVQAATGIKIIELVQVTQPSAGTRLVTYDQTTQALRVFTAIGTEAVNATDQSAFTVQALIVGI